MFNLTRSLSSHGGPNNPTSGIVSEIVIGEMREISQYVFQVFKVRYIDKNINIFEDVLGLSAEAIRGESNDYIKSKVTDDELNNKILGLKSALLSFIIYQLGSTIYSSGIPCGFYDVEGDKDKHGIKESINKYLFETCFNPGLNDRNYEYFLYYLFINFQDTFRPFMKQKPNIDDYLKVLDKDRIKAYWREHSQKIIVRELYWKDNRLIIGDYETSCTNQLEVTFTVLDELLQQEEVQLTDI